MEISFISAITAAFGVGVRSTDPENYPVLRTISERDERSSVNRFKPFIICLNSFLCEYLYKY